MKYIYFTSNYSSYRGGGSRICSKLLFQYVQEIVNPKDIFLLNITTDKKPQVTTTESESFTMYAHIPPQHTIFALLHSPEGVFVQSLKYRVLEIINSIAQSHPGEEFIILYDSDVPLMFTKIISTCLDFTIKKQIFINHSIGHLRYLKAKQLSLFENIISKVTNQDIGSYIDLLSHMDEVICFTHKDKEFLSHMISIPICVIHPLLYPQDELHTPHPSEKTVLITTNISFEENKLSLEWFLNHVFPFLDPHIHVRITGKGDYTEYKEQFKQNDKILFLGYVHHFVLQKLFLHSTVVVNPTIRGEGRIQVKLLEAMSYNCDIISTNFANHFPEFIKGVSDAKEMVSAINSYILGSSKLGYDHNYIDFFEDNKAQFYQILLPSQHEE